MGIGKSWTKEDVSYLEENWGKSSLISISKNLNRTLIAIKLKGQRLGLGDARAHYDGISLNQLSKAIGLDYKILRTLAEEHSLPVKSKVFGESRRTLVVKYSDFWKWAERNIRLLDLSRMEKNSLGPEPKWMEEKRKAEYANKVRVKHSHNDPWTPEEDARLKGMLSAFKYTYSDIATAINRTESAIKRRIWHLNLKQRPLRRDNHVKYTEEEINLIIRMFNKGYSFDAIAAKTGKSALGIRGKLERMGYRFTRGAAILQ